jgi:hypothetical protein
LSEVKPPRAVLADVTATFLGLMSLAVDVVPMKRAEARIETHMACPKCATAARLKQRYVCPDDAAHGPFEPSETKRCVATAKDVYRLVDDDELETFKPELLPKGEATFRVFRADEVEAVTFPAGGSYRLRPRKPTTMSLQSYKLIADLLLLPGFAWLCELVSRDTQHLYRAINRGDGVITLMELTRPGEFHPAEAVDINYDNARFDQAVAQLSSSVEDFDPADYSSAVRAQAEAFAAGATPAPPSSGPAIVVTDDTALLALLEASVDAAPAPPASPAPARRRNLDRQRVS